MKHIIIICIGLACCASVGFARIGLGPGIGRTFGDMGDATVFGIHLDLGEVLPGFRFTPGFEYFQKRQLGWWNGHIGDYNSPEEEWKYVEIFYWNDYEVADINLDFRYYFLPARIPRTSPYLGLGYNVEFVRVETPRNIGKKYRYSYHQTSFDFSGGISFKLTSWLTTTMEYKFVTGDGHTIPRAQWLVTYYF